MRASAVAAFHVAIRPLALLSLALLARRVARRMATFAVIARLRCRWRVRVRAQLTGDKSTALRLVEFNVTINLTSFKVTQNLTNRSERKGQVARRSFHHKYDVHDCVDAFTEAANHGAELLSHKRVAQPSVGRQGTIQSSKSMVQRVELGEGRLTQAFE
eukprot:6212211-Pleurochrysis_carterae.AAC.1